MNEHVVLTSFPRGYYLKAGFYMFFGWLWASASCFGFVWAWASVFYWLLE